MSQNQSNQKPLVFPTQEQRREASNSIEKTKLEQYEAEKALVTNEIYSNAHEASTNVTNNHLDAIKMMQERSNRELEISRNGGTIQYPELAEKEVKKFVQTNLYPDSTNQISARDEQLKRNQEQISNYQKSFNEASNRVTTRYQAKEPEWSNSASINDNRSYNNYNEPPKPPINSNPIEINDDSNLNKYIFEISQPNYNCTHDVLRLPSEGKIYRNVPSSIRTAFLTTSDENILTSPNILESGRFLEILLNRKILEPTLRYKHLHIGDRNSLMIWLRATGYGEMYPITLFDENDVPFDTEINLNDLKTKKLGAEPDEDGLFYYQFPLCKARVRFRFLTCGDIDDIEKRLDEDRLNGYPVNDESIYKMEKMIIEVNGDRDRNIINEFVKSIRIGDTDKFNDYVSSIESGIDLNIEVRTPGGGSVKTFLPLNINFFWPKLKL